MGSALVLELRLRPSSAGKAPLCDGPHQEASRGLTRRVLCTRCLRPPVLPFGPAVCLTCVTALGKQLDTVPASRLRGGDPLRSWEGTRERELGRSHGEAEGLSLRVGVADTGPWLFSLRWDRARQG